MRLFFLAFFLATSTFAETLTITAFYSKDSCAKLNFEIEEIVDLVLFKEQLLNIVVYEGASILSIEESRSQRPCIKKIKVLIESEKASNLKSWIKAGYMFMPLHHIEGDMFSNEVRK